MRILYITSMLPFGPMEAFFIPEIRELRRLGHQVTVVPMWPRGPVIHEDARELVEIVRAQPLLSLEIAAAGLGTAAAHPLRSCKAVLGLFRSRSPRIAAKNALVVPKAFWLARVARELAVDHIHAHWGATTATMGWIAHRLTSIPWSFTVHRWDIAENNLLERKAASASFVRAISSRGKNAVRRHLGRHVEKAQWLPMGVDIPEGLTSPGPRTAPLRLVVAANLLEVKGHRYLLDAVATLARRGVALQLDIAGGGPLEAQLREDVARHRLESFVSMLGVVPHAEILEGMRTGRWNAAVLPSITLPDGEQEGIPVFLIEAMACGLPVVSTHTGAIPELVTKGTGLLVAERDPDALADALEKLARSPVLRGQIAAEASRRVRDTFSVRAVVAELVQWMERATA